MTFDIAAAVFFTFDHPHYLWLLLLALPMIWLGRRSLASADRWRRRVAVALRLIVLVLLVTILAGLQTVRVRDDLAVVALVDQSESVRRYVQPPASSDGTAANPLAEVRGPTAVDEWLDFWLRGAVDQRGPDDAIGLVTFDGRPTVRSMPGPSVDLVGSVMPDAIEGTDLATAVRRGMAIFPEGAARRMVLVSDGNDTTTLSGLRLDDADLIAAAREAAAAGVRIDVMPLNYLVRDEVMVEGVYAPVEAKTGQTVAVRVALRATKPTPGKLFLKHDGQLIDLAANSDDVGLPVSADAWVAQGLPGSAGDSANAGFVYIRRFEAPLNAKGPNRFEAVFEPIAGRDRMVSNNRGEAVTLVSGKGRVLFVNQVEGESGVILPNTLRQRGLDVEVIGAAQLPVRLDGLRGYDAVYFQNVPADIVVEPQQKTVARFVRDLGGGFVMVGGPDSFGAGNWNDTTIDEILPVACEVPNEKVMPGGALVIVLDRSNSMMEPVAGGIYTKQQIANESAVQALTTLQPRDLFGLVAFDSSPQWIVDLRPNLDPNASAKKIRAVKPNGGTDIYPGLKLAYNALRVLGERDASVKHVILLTDGQSPKANFDELVKNMRDAGITLSTVGVGNNINQQLLTRLAGAGGGKFHHVQDATLLPRIFIKEARIVRKPLLREQRFTPALRKTGSPVTTGLTTTPALNGHVLTGRKNDPRVFMPMVSDKDDPVFAHWQVGLGQVAAFTSDATNRWATDWLPWPGYGDFWARTTRQVARPAADRGFDLNAMLDRGTLRLRLDATGAAADEADRSFVNFMRVEGVVIGPDGVSKNVTLRQTGPGVYTANVPARETGSYLVTLVSEDAAGRRRTIIGQATRPPGAELRNFTSNRAVLEQIASITGGRVLEPTIADPAALFDHDGVEPTRSVRPVWWPLLIVLLVVLLLDVAARRLAWDGATLRRWVGGVFGAAQPKPTDSTQTLGALRKRADVVEQETGKQRPKSSPQPTAARTPDAPAATYVHEADEPMSVPQDASLFGKRKKKVADDDGDDGADTDTTSSESTRRLLDAKRRARRRH